MFKIKKIHPTFTGVVTTAKRYVESEAVTESGLIVDTKKLMGAVNTFQTVIAVGPMVKDIEPGDVVCINFSRYAIPEHRRGKVQDNVETDNLGYSYSIPSISLDGQECLMLQNNDIEYYMEPGDYETDDGGLFE